MRSDFGPASLSFVAAASCRPANRLICKEFAEAIRRHKTSSSKNAFNPNDIAPQSSGLKHECGASLGMFPHVGEMSSNTHLKFPGVLWFLLRILGSLLFTKLPNHLLNCGGLFLLRAEHKKRCCPGIGCSCFIGNHSNRTKFSQHG